MDQQDTNLFLSSPALNFHNNQNPTFFTNDTFINTFYIFWKNHIMLRNIWYHGTNISPIHSRFIYTATMDHLFFRSNLVVLWSTVLLLLLMSNNLEAHTSVHPQLNRQFIPWTLISIRLHKFLIIQIPPGPIRIGCDHDLMVGSCAYAIWMPSPLWRLWICPLKNYSIIVSPPHISFVLSHRY